MLACCPCAKYTHSGPTMKLQEALCIIYYSKRVIRPTDFNVSRKQESLMWWNSWLTITDSYFEKKTPRGKIGWLTIIIVVIQSVTEGVKALSNRRSAS